MKDFNERVLDYLFEESGSMDRYTVRYVEGNKNNEGDPAPWCIIKNVNKPGEKIISSLKTKKDAVKHFREMAWYKENKTRTPGYKRKEL